MTDTALTSRELRERSQTRLLSELEDQRLKTIGYVDAEQTDYAKKSTNHMAQLIRLLRPIYKARRGRPREELGLRVQYYALWQQALYARLVFKDKKMKPEPVIYGLLRGALIQAVSLSGEYPEHEEFSQLADKLEEYYREASSNPS